MKYLSENLFEFKNLSSYLNEKEDVKIKKDNSLQKEEEKEGMDVIKKLQDNFSRFTSAAGGKILKYKEFWEENKSVADSFDDKGAIYKMFDMDYVVGILQLPDIALSAEELNNEIELIDRKRKKEGKESDGEDNEEDDDQEVEEETDEVEDEVEEETEEVEEEDADANEWIRPKGKKFIFEGDKKKEPKLGFDFNSDAEVEDSLELPEETEDSEDSLEISDESNKDSLEFSDSEETKEYFVVYNLTGDDRDEIFRTDNPKVIKLFQDFYENTFKASIKNQIQLFKTEKLEKEQEAQEKAKEELKKKRKTKFDKFIKENKN